ncbi:MAG: hypothetical protein R2911_31450 [Caldilineaceae bacterium]
MIESTLKLVIGNGADGSFGHLHAKRHGTRQGVRTPEEWMGFAATADAAARLTRMVAAALLAAGVPVWAFSPAPHCAVWMAWWRMDRIGRWRRRCNAISSALYSWRCGAGRCAAARFGTEEIMAWLKRAVCLR